MPTPRQQSTFGRANRRFEPPLVVGEFSSSVGSVTSPAAYEVTERPDQDGGSFLQCNCPQYAMTQPGDEPFCEHMRVVLENNWDGHPKDAPVRNLPFRVWVPIFQRPGLTVQVIHEPVLNNPKLEQVSILRYFEASPSHPNGGTEPDFIGFIQLGQGRGAIRTLVTEWLIEQAAKPIPKCVAPYHGKLMKQMIDPRSKKDLAYLADVLITGSCRQCNEDTAIPNV